MLRFNAALFVVVLTTCIATAQVSIEESPFKIIPELSASTEVDFKLAGGLILLNAENDGQRGEYILDTGAPCLILNKKVKKKDAHLLAVGINGQMHVAETKIETFKLGQFIREQIKCLSLDISHIELSKKRKISGLIGYDLFEGKELLFDYENLSIAFFEANEIQEYKDQKRLKKIPFKMHGHLPIIKVKIGNKNFKFGIDTGAEVNVINSADASKIKQSIYKEIETAHIQSVNEEKTNVSAIVVSQIKVGKKEKEAYTDLRFIIADLSSFNSAYGVQLDGLLGYSFLRERLHSIDFLNEELVIWE